MDGGRGPSTARPGAVTRGSRRMRRGWRVESPPRRPPMSARSLGLLALALALSLGALARAENPPAAHPERVGGVLVFARGADSVTLDPPKAEDGESVAVIDNVFDGLVRYSDEG